MFAILIVSFSLVFAKSLASVVITAYDPITEIRAQLQNITPRGILGWDIEGFLEKNGYPFEDHTVTTPDDYILGLHRIPYGRNSTDSEDETRPTVLVMHGMGSSSGDFLILGPERSLPLLLADQGYDVWLGNNRGNTWSKKHQTLDPDANKTFWDFSFHEMGVNDAATIIDYVLAKTGHEKISYIGHSQGSTQFFVLAAEEPEYNDKINIMMALGPAVYCQNISNPIVQVVKEFYTIVELGGNYLNLTEILGHSTLLETVLKLICKDDSDYQEVCPFLLFLLFGFDSQQFDRSILTTFLDVFPGGFSMKSLKHYLQLVKSGHFRQYDHGILNNLEIYNQTAPPDYDISKVTAPVALYYGKNDWLVSAINVEQLADELPNVVEKYLIEYDYFNHMDFIVATDVVSMLYFDLINKLNEVNDLDPFTTSEPTTTTANPDPDKTTSKPTPTRDPDSSETTTQGSAYSMNSFLQMTCILVVSLMLIV